MTAIDRKREELKRKLASLDEEFSRWTVAIDSGDFQRHYTQVRGVMLPLQQLKSKVEGDLAGKTGDAFLAEARTATVLILGIHRIWEFFRQKLTQRQDDRLRYFLEVADEFAWHCYSPVVKRTRHRRPPLVYLNGGASPFVIRRDERFQMEGGEADSIADIDFQRVLAHLPFPVIGIPWHQLEYWPEMVVIGHEVGHAVERDLDLEKVLDQAIASTVRQDAFRTRCWKAWRSELFADLYGCVATGPAFVRALGDFLANSAQTLQAAAPSAQSAYPPAILRIVFNQCVLKRLGLPESISGWDVPLPKQLEPYAKDADAIARTLLGPKGCCKGLLEFSPQQWKAAEARASDAINLRDPRKKPTDLRVLIASIRCLFESASDKWDQGKPTPLAQITADIEPMIENTRRSAKNTGSKGQDLTDTSTAQSLYDILVAGTLE